MSYSYVLRVNSQHHVWPALVLCRLCINARLDSNAIVAFNRLKIQELHGMVVVVAVMVGGRGHHHLLILWDMDILPQAMNIITWLTNLFTFAWLDIDSEIALVNYTITLHRSWELLLTDLTQNNYLHWRQILEKLLIQWTLVKVNLVNMKDSCQYKLTSKSQLRSHSN